MEQNSTTEKIPEDIINLVIARLETIPPNVSLSVGGDDGQSITVQELIKRVREQDDVGRKMVELQLAYIRTLSGVSSSGVATAAA